MTPRSTDTGWRLLCCLAFGWAAQASAADVTYTLSTGPGNFDAHAVDSGFELASNRLRLDVGYYRAFGDGSTLEQFTGSARWDFTGVDSLTLSGKQIDDDVMRIKGGAVSAALNLNRLWLGERSSTLNLAYGRHGYAPEGARRLAAALVSLFPDQTYASAGLRQSLPAAFSATLDYTRYRYDRDPSDLARAIAVGFSRQRRNVPSQAFTLLGFPDRTLAAGLSWMASERLTLEANLSQTDTVVDQRLRSLSLGVRYSDGTVTLGSTLTRSTSTEVLGPRGQLEVIPASAGTYIDFRIGVVF